MINQFENILNTKWCYFCNKPHPREESIMVQLIDRKSKDEINVDACKECVPVPDEVLNKIKRVVIYI